MDKIWSCSEHPEMIPMKNQKAIWPHDFNMLFYVSRVNIFLKYLTHYNIILLSIFKKANEHQRRKTKKEVRKPSHENNINSFWHRHLGSRFCLRVLFQKET